MTLHKQNSSLAQKCPIRDVLDRTSDRWSILILDELEPGPQRFTVLKKQIGDISQRMLAQTLRKLEQDGFVSREVFPTIPPRVEYTLTALGHSFLVPVRQMMRWAAENQHAVHSARQSFNPPEKYIAK